MPQATLLAAAFAVLFATAPPAVAQDATPPSEPSGEQPWYYGSEQPQRVDPMTVHQRKAQARGAQRAARMAAMEWYGMSNARPRAAATPFTTQYSPVWQAPGGRPFAWYPMRRTVYIYR